MTEPVGAMREGLLLVMAALLAALAGMVDAIGYLHLNNGLFVSFMSGNSIQFAIALGQGGRATAATIGELILFFVIGAAGGQMLADVAGNRQITWVLVSVAILLVVSGLLATAAEPMTFAMGALNAAMNRAGHTPVSVTFVTGVLVRLGQGLGNLLIRGPTGWNWLLQAVPWIGLITGAVIGAFAYTKLGAAVIWGAVGFAGALAAVSLVIPQPKPT